ncbi:hypothetical protein ACFV0T_34930 [Streptomyces sp. NPDC059582]|uniref:hypothetical protein n=1 Tax=Streptomyces sp. NPDC059582 TaxID=3346875 RepID=UPI00368C4356
MLRQTDAALLDFDRPVTDLFGDAPTALIAHEVEEMARAEWGPLDDDAEACEDSHGILRHLRDMYDRPSTLPRDRRALEQAEAIGTRHEYDAARSALPALFLSAHR